jgi:hypothetical protein
MNEMQWVVLVGSVRQGVHERMLFGVSVVCARVIEPDASEKLRTFNVFVLAALARTRPHQAYTSACRTG